MERGKPGPPPRFNVKEELSGVQVFTAVLITISFLISSILNPYLVYHYYHNKIPNLGHVFYQILSLANFLAILVYGPYFLWWLSSSEIPEMTHMDGISSAFVLSLIMISSTTTVYLSGAKVLALRYPFYVMSRRIKLILKSSLACIALALVLFEISGVLISGECFHSTPNVFPIFLISVNTTTMKIACFSKRIQDRANEAVNGGRRGKLRYSDEGVFKPHLLVFFITAVLGLILSGFVIWEILKVKRAMKRNQDSNQKSGVVTTLLLNLGNALNAIFCALDLFLELDLKAHLVVSLMTMIFFPMLLCSFCPLVITLRGSRVKQDIRGSFAKARSKTELALRRLS